MIKSLITGMVVLAQIVLITRLGIETTEPSPERLLMLLLIATIPFVREPLIRILEEREKERRKTNN